MMDTEPLLKMKTHAVSTTINFVKGLLEGDEEEEENSTANSKIMESYQVTLFEYIVALLGKALSENYEPLQEEVMSLLSVVASLIEGAFSSYFNNLIPLMMQILNNVGTANMQQMTLRARTIEAMGYMIEAVAESPEKNTFTPAVLEITKILGGLLGSGLTNDDP